MGDFCTLDELIDESAVWHVSGRNQLSGDYRGRREVYGFMRRLREVTDGTFAVDVHAILADDEHGVALVAASGSREGRAVQTKDVHIFHFRQGLVTENWTASTDQYALDELFR